MFWFDVLDRHLLGRNDFVANNRPSIADYYGGCIVTAGHLIGCTFAAYPNVRRWLDRLQALASWNTVSADVCRFAAQLQGTKFIVL